MASLCSSLVQKCFQEMSTETCKGCSCNVKGNSCSGRQKAVREKAKSVMEKLRAEKLDGIAKFIEETLEETLSYMDFSSEHWRRIRTSNGLERMMKESRRRTRVVGSFPQ